MTSVSLEDVFSQLDSIKTFSWSKLKPYSFGSNHIKTAEFNYGIVSNAFNSLYKITPSIENKLYKIFERFNALDYEFELADITLLDKYWHFRLNIAKKYNMTLNEKEPMQDLLYLWFAIYHMQVIAEENSRNINTFGKYVFPCILKNKYMAYIIFDEESVSSIYSIGVVNKYTLNDGVSLVKINGWENVVSQSEFRRNK